jgi:protein arginine kinase
MTLDELLTQSGEWLKGTGPEADIVISSRVRLARNLRDIPFAVRATEQQKRDLEERIREKTASSPFFKDALSLDVAGIDNVDRLLLVERHLISREHASAQGPRGVTISRQETLSLMTNEEDHLRIQALRSGLQLDAAWQEANAADDALETMLPYAYSPQLGYLTACPTNVGTGMRLSTLLHLPGIVLAKQVDRVFHTLARINYSVRGLYGEGSQALGDFYQISSQTSLGKSEPDMIAEMQSSIVPEVAKFERSCREKLMKENGLRITDRVSRSYGILGNAQLITSEETLELLSSLRFGVYLEIIKDVDLKLLNELFIFSQPGHIQKLAGKTLEPAERDRARAELIRRRLAS